MSLRTNDEIISEKKKDETFSLLEVQIANNQLFPQHLLLRTYLHLICQPCIHETPPLRHAGSHPFSAGRTLDIALSVPHLLQTIH